MPFSTILLFWASSRHSAFYMVSAILGDISQQNLVIAAIRSVTRRKLLLSKIPRRKCVELCLSNAKSGIHLFFKQPSFLFVLERIE